MLWIKEILFKKTNERRDLMLDILDLMLLNSIYIVHDE
jgi:hypothetical protein